MDTAELFLPPRYVTSALQMAHETLNKWRSSGIVRNLDAERQEVAPGGVRLYSLGDFRALAICSQAQKLGVLDRFLGAFARDAAREFERGARVLYIEYIPDGAKTTTRVRFDEAPGEFAVYLAVNMAKIIEDAEHNLKLVGAAVALRRKAGFTDEGYDL